MARLRRLGPLSPFPRSLVKAPLTYLLVYRIGPSLLPTATEDRLGAGLWRTRPAIPKIPFKTRNEPLRFLLGQRKRILLAKALEQSYSAGQPYHGYYFKCERYKLLQRRSAR